MIYLGIDRSFGRLGVVVRVGTHPRERNSNAQQIAPCEPRIEHEEAKRQHDAGLEMA